MEGLRADIASAASRMTITFACRSAIRHLVHSLLDGEQVLEMASCIFAGSEGLLVLTDKRVLAVRDDFSRYHSRGVDVDGVTHLDYGPRVHDGFAAFTASEKLAVRRMPVVDSDRIVATLTERRPTVIVATSKPGLSTRDAVARAAAAQTAATTQVVSAVDATAATSGVAITSPGAADPAAPTAEASTTGVSIPATSATSAGSTTPSVPAALAPVLDADTAVLLGVLADLHARGLLTAEELAAKSAQIAVS